MRGVVIYTQRVEVIESYNERRDCSDQQIPMFIRACGYIPVPCPNVPEIARELILQIKPIGIVMTGGNSLVKYGGNAPEKDQTDSTIIEVALKEAIPIYAFCRGMQSILDYFGNSLVNIDGHVAKRHVIEGEIGSIEVNSFHNQGCFEVQDSLKILGKTKDGNIEAIESKEFKIVATMWHPERQTPFCQEDIVRVQKLFNS